jgi:hypothetical protein
MLAECASASAALLYCRMALLTRFRAVALIDASGRQAAATCLPFPPLALPALRGNGRQIFEQTCQEALHEGPQ